MTIEQVLIAAAVIVLAGLALIGLWIYWKGRPFAQGDVFRASRLSRGNRLFPTQVLITPHSVVHHTPQWVGKLEETIHLAHVASVRIDTNLMFSDVAIETSGGTNPVVCHGHSKKDAVRMKALIEEYQSAYYRAPSQAPPAAPPPAATPPGTVASPPSSR
ncbi:MAG TPA: hypothetical protein PKK95_02880 [Vicinamibacterales bacterium]|jgi:hypothetical protein|nr:hypothetical protein [Acidobacteriota bacterium]HOC17181.1 hypothetical protein [Vicinamibacterales bacterium]